MRASRFPSASAAAVLVASPALPACLDTSPVAFDAGVADATIEVDAEVVATCRACVMTGACEPQYAVCTQNPKCRALFDCLTAAYCLTAADMVPTAPTRCFTECNLDAGIQGQSDPALVPVLPLLMCAGSPMGCSVPCNAGAQDP
jgi:hypothetical protein